jgi:hypothetical protein
MFAVRSAGRQHGALSEVGAARGRAAGDLMIRIAVAVWLGLLMVACASMPGPRSFTLSPGDIERQIEADLGATFELFKGLDVRRPEVALMPVSGRLQLTWTVRVPDGPTSSPLGVAVSLTGTPALNAGRSGVDLTEVMLEDVRVTGVPMLFSFGLAQLGDRKGATLPDLPLMALPAEQLTRSQVAYGATGVAVTFTGLRVDLEPR